MIEFNSQDYKAPFDTQSANDYLEGQTDCRNGSPRLLGQSTMYYRGYDDEKKFMEEVG